MKKGQFKLFTEFGYIQNNRWYHIRIDFRCEGAGFYGYLPENYFQVTVDDYFSTNHPDLFKEFIISTNSINKFSFFTYYAIIENQKIWIDAIGYSWDAYYSIGENLEEGLKLDISKNEDIIYSECAIDGGDRIPIPGDTIISLSHAESHAIQVFGQYPNGTWIESPLYPVKMIGQKIGVFLWGSDLCASSYIYDYRGILLLENYFKFYMFKDSHDPIHDLRIVERYETSVDTLYIHSGGHGNVLDGNSYATYVNGQFSSDDFRNIIDDVETSRKAWLFDHCKAGNFVFDFSDAPYSFLAMSSTNHWTLAYATAGQLWFSYYFYKRVFWNGAGKSAVQAFDYADFWLPCQKAQIDDNCEFSFFTTGVLD